MKILALAGGVGGAKMAHGLAQVLPPQDLTIIVNTGDDFEHLGLSISPDLDTVCYTLAGLANPETGWGRKDETWNFIANLERLGGESWFRLGDQDLATHIERARRLRDGQPLSQITREFCRAWGIEQTVLPMSDSPARTMVQTDEGELPFQEYFVRRQCQPRVQSFRFEGIAAAQPAPGAREALAAAEAIILCPSNPWVSIDPILRVLPIQNKKVVAVSPIIGGKAVKGPAAKMYAELGIEPSALAVARHYGELLSGFILDEQDAALAKKTRIPTLATETIMKNNADRAQLAERVLQFIGSL
ncbi:MAG: 2-phospho-L-lactate transferase [Anaerolineales bacterium]